MKTPLKQLKEHQRMICHARQQIPQLRKVSDEMVGRALLGQNVEQLRKKLKGVSGVLVYKKLNKIAPFSPGKVEFSAKFVEK